MTDTTVAMTLRARSDSWDDLLELLEDLEPYTPAPRDRLYPVVQAIAEGRETRLEVYERSVDEFAQHMREYRIDASRARA